MTALSQPTPSVKARSAGTRTPLGRRLLRRPVGLASAVVLAIIAILAVTGPWLAPHDPNTASMSLILEPPGAEHPLGADSSGRDVVSRLLTATRVSIAAALVALVTALILGVSFGLVAGYYRGWFDSLSNWGIALLMAMPGMVVLLAVRAALGPSVYLAMFVFGILLSPVYFRLVYAAVSAVRDELYIDAARVSGLSDARIISNHVLRVVRAPIIIQSAIVAGITIAIQSGLEFLGLGDHRVPTWGQMLNDAFTNIHSTPLLMVWPSATIALTCVALALFANTLRDELQRTVNTSRRRRRKMEGRQTTTEGQGSDQAHGVDESVIVHPADQRIGEGETLLAVEGLRVGYDQPDGSVTGVVHGVSLDVHRGEVHGLIGESGSGKTQTAFSILGLLPPGGRVTAGSLRFDDVDLADASEKLLTQMRGVRIGYIPQEPMSNLDPSFTIGSQLVEPLRARLGMNRKESKDRALELLARVGIPEPERTFGAYPFEVSGGMAQRVLIAGAVSTAPELIIADEPTTALDVTVQAEVLELLRDLQKEHQMAVLLVTHNFGVVADLCDRVTVMQEGRFVEQGPVRSIFHEAAHPYTHSLLEAILDESPARGTLTAMTGGAR